MARRVVFVLPDFEAGGAQRVMVTVANALDRARFLPSIIALTDYGPWRSLVAPDIAVTGLGRARLRQSLGALRSALRRAAPDVIVSRADRSRFRLFGRNWNFEGRSAEICQLDWGNQKR